MAGGLVVHITNGQEKHTEVLSQEHVLIGPGENCHIRLGSDLLSDSSVLLELARHNGHFRVQEFDPEIGITLNGKPLARGARIEDGDELRFGAFGVAMQFFPVGNLPAVVSSRRASVAPFIEQAAIEAAATARRDDAKVFLREFTRELLREINWSTKVLVFLIAVTLVGGLLYLGDAVYTETRRGRELIKEQNDQLAHLQDELNKTNSQFGVVAGKNQEIIDSLSLAPRLFGQYGNGVCLIAGSYMIFEPGTGRPLRYPETQTTEDGTALKNGGEQPVLTPEGNGPPFIRDFVGTGFHVGGGYVVTNRHLGVEPWTADEGVQALSASVHGQFRITRIVAFFPGQSKSLVLHIRQTTPRDDLAVGLIDATALPPGLPVLPLDKDSDTAAVGKAVVMMGYPSGEERLIATIPEAEARGIRERYGSSVESLLTYLAEHNYVKPLTTQGHITALESRDLVYDARNAVGGSGSPLFGQSGRVIGVNFATFTEMADQNYAVPIRFAFPLLQRAGWQSGEAAEEPNANANLAPAKDARPNANQPR
ncbi:MAG TPA: trypsin-like peptidase domain-containing protein [Pyrinomonadaceae bacterium]|jgi:S1-C subfamily serine protease|nr:trypsin-like peptidase domain-containing protein [Pyrinomonadaceae bacterium]